MTVKTSLMLGYKVLEDLQTAPREPLTEEELKAIEIVMIKLAKEYMLYSKSEAVIGDGSDEVQMEFLDEDMVQRMETYNMAAKKSMNFKTKAERDAEKNS